MKESWFDQEVKLRIEIGTQFDEQGFKKMEKVDQVAMSASRKLINKGMCILCYGPFSDDDDEMLAINMACGHQFCKGCWTDHLKESLDQGKAKCLSTKCMQHKCNMVVSHSMFLDLLASEPDLVKKYKTFHCLGFTDDNKNMKWCP